MKILFLGNTAPGGSASHRAAALFRVGHDVTTLDPMARLPKSRLLNKLHQWTGFRVATGVVNRSLERQLSGRRYDLVWVDGGACLGPGSIDGLRALAKKVINYNLDDPTGRRDGNLWMTLKRAIPHYDLMVAVRSESAVEYRALGAKDVMQVYRSYDEVAHVRLAADIAEREKWRSEVVFVGTWMPERGPLVEQLIKAGVPLTIWGDRWQRAPEWRVLKQRWRGPALYLEDYVGAIQHAKAALGLLSKGNRDQHTQRSAEIPFIGTALCAESSGEHGSMFRHGEHAMLWKTVDECVRSCRELLGDESLRHRIAAAGRSRVIELGLGNEPTVERILERAFERNPVSIESKYRTWERQATA